MCINEKGLGKPTVEGESPVLVNCIICSSILSRGRPEESALNSAVPSAKAKYD